MKAARPWHPYALLLPTVLILGLFFLYPLLLAVYRSFFAWDLLTEPTFVGLGHYRTLIGTGELTAIALRTLGYGVVVVVCSVAIGLSLALALNRQGMVFAFVRGSVFSAYIVSWVAVGLLWLWILDGEAGVLSRSLRAIGLPTADWLSDPDVALTTLAAVTVWKITGYAMVIFLAGLQDIPKSMLEAAALDGASPWRRFWNITWPLLRPTVAFVGTTSLILSFQAFDIVRVMTQGGPVKSTTVFVYAIYEQVFMNLRVGRASALTVVFFAMLVVLTILQLWAWRLGAKQRVAT
ncbi:MAG: sugar ABC transporter permease [Deltaproteobacteria bacterium]|nr:sugar ABC transporter permease [Deltaproteobacteria bacterium]